MPSPATRSTLAAAAILALFTASGCTGSDSDLPTIADASAGAIGSANPEAISAAEQLESAEALLACLTDADLPATLTPVDSGGARMSWAEAGFDITYAYPGGGGMVSKQSGEVDPNATKQLQEALVDGFGLVVDGVDHTATFKACYEASGYTDPASDGPTLGEELEQKQALAEVTNPWIACAREHGFASLADVTAVADNWLTYPSARIPFDTPAETLRAVFDACPAEPDPTQSPDPEANFDIIEASISIDAPAGVAEAAAEPDADLSDPDIQHYRDLEDVLAENTRQVYRPGQDDGVTLLTPESPQD
jgi:hypothetical protein